MSLKSRQIRWAQRIAPICLALIALPALSATTTYSYDALGRLQTVSRGTGTGITYSLDGAGNRRSMTVATSGIEVTDVLTMTQGNWVSGPIVISGYNPSTGTGALNPTTLSGGYSVAAFYDNKNGPSLIETIFRVSGFAADPGQAWLTSAKVGANTRTGATAQYTYGSGTAQWRWVPPLTTIFGSSGNVSCTIIHK